MDEKRKRTRRKGRRVIEPLPTLVFWKGVSGRHEADICDVGMGGCYLNTKGEAGIGEHIVLEVPTASASEKVIRLSGTVVPQQRKLKGFGLRFEALSEEQQSLIARLMASSLEKKERRD